MTTEPKIVERRGKVYVEYDSVGDAFSDVTAYAALRTRLAEAEGLLREYLTEKDDGHPVKCVYRAVKEKWPDGTTKNLCEAHNWFDPCWVGRARAFLEGSQEVNVAEARKMSDREFLWQLLDDIDTLYDACKGDEHAFYEQVKRVHKRRFERATTDGYTLSWNSPEHLEVSQ